MCQTERERGGKKEGERNVSEGGRDFSCCLASSHIDSLHCTEPPGCDSHTGLDNFPHIHTFPIFPACPAVSHTAAPGTPAVLRPALPPEIKKEETSLQSLVGVPAACVVDTCRGDALHAKGEEHTTETIRVQGLEKHTDMRVHETQISWKRNGLASSRLVERYTLVMRVERCEPLKNNHKAVPGCESPELKGRKEKERTPEGTQQLGEGRNLMHTDVHTHTHTHTLRSLSARVVLIRLMRPFTCLTDEVVPQP